MKQDEIKNCLMCGKGVAHNQQITFYRIKIEQLVLNLPAIRRQAGLEMMLGNPQIAAAMGYDEDIALPVTEKEGLVCLDCFIGNYPLACFFEKLVE